MTKWRSRIPKPNHGILQWAFSLFAGILCSTVLIVWLSSSPPEDLSSIPSEKGSHNSASDDTQDQHVTTSTSPSSKNNETIKLVDAPTRVIAPGMTPAWAHVKAPLERVKDYRDEIDPRLKTAKAYKSPIVLSAGEFKIRDGKRFLKVSLKNVDALPFQKRCQHDNGEMWFCGGKARAQLSLMLRQRTLYCNVDVIEGASPNTPSPAQCWLGTIDLADIVIREGWGTPAGQGNNRQLELLASAKRLGKGMWHSN